MNATRTTRAVAPVLIGLAALLAAGCAGTTTSAPNQQQGAHVTVTAPARGTGAVADGAAAGGAPGGPGGGGSGVTSTPDPTASGTAPTPTATPTLPPSTMDPTPPGYGDPGVVTLPPGFELPPFAVETPHGIVATPLGGLHIPDGVIVNP